MRAIFLFAVFLLGFSGFSLAQSASELDYDFTEHKYKFFDGASNFFLSLGITAGACTEEGARDYDDLLNVYKYCNGTNWVLLTGSPTLSFCTKEAEIDFFSSSYHYCNGAVWVDMKGSLIP